MEENKDIKKEIRDYLKEESDTHIRHWIAIKRESKRLYSDIEDRTKKIALKSSSLIKEEDLEKIMSYHVMALPALVVDEKVVAKGVISEAEIKKALMKAE